MMTRRIPISSTLLALAYLTGSLGAADQLGPFSWTRALLDADPALQSPADTAADGTIETASLDVGSSTDRGVIRVRNWAGTTRTGSYGVGAHTLRLPPGASYAVGMNGWSNGERVDTGAGWIQVSRLSQDAKLVLFYVGANQTPLPIEHGATLGVGSVMPAPAIAVTLVFRRNMGGSGESVWQTGSYSGNPLQMSVTQIPAGKTLMQAQAETGSVNRLALLTALTETTPDRPYQIAFRTRAGGQWQVSLDLDGDGQMDVDQSSGVNGAKPATVGDVDQSGGLYVSSAPAMGSPAGTVAVSDLTLTYQRTDANWQTDLLDRRPITVERQFSSRVSPALVSGNTWRSNRTVAIAPGDLDRFENGTFLARTPLSEETRGGSAVLSQSGTPATTVPIQVQWLTTAITQGGSQTIRTGDSLLLAADEGYTDAGGAVESFIDPLGTGEWLPWGTREDAAKSFRYDQPGTYQAQARIVTQVEGEAVVREYGPLTIQVSNFRLPDYLPSEAGFTRAIQLPTGVVPANTIRLTSSPAGSIVISGTAAVGRAMTGSLKAVANNAPMLVAQTSDGTVLDARGVSTFDFTVPTGSVIGVRKTYPDGSILMDGRLRMAPLRPDLVAKMSIFTTGAAFADGGLSLSVPSAAFIASTDGAGEAGYDLYRSSKSKAGPCHSVMVLHNTTAVGQ
jgi:hypothetical protein